MSSFSPTPPFCIHCGSALPPGALFCTTCGIRVTSTAAAAAPPPPPPPPPPAWEPAAPPPPTVPTQVVAAPRPPGQRGILITFGVVAALAVLGAGLWLGTRNSDTAATGGAGSTTPATSLAPSATPPAVQIATTTPGATPPVVTAPPATTSPATAPPVTPPPVTAPPVTAPPAHPCPTLHYNETLPLGMCDEGFPVQLLQTRLNELGGYGLEEDGQFGPASQAAVRAYQTEHGLAANGTADYPTWRSLFLGVGLPGEDLNGDGVITPDEIIYD